MRKGLTIVAVVGLAIALAAPAFGSATRGVTVRVAACERAQSLAVVVEQHVRNEADAIDAAIDYLRRGAVAKARRTLRAADALAVVYGGIGPRIVKSTDRCID